MTLSFPAHLRLRLGLLAFLATLFAACGPTTGGTGTGDAPFALSEFGATAASPCTATFASTLACVQGSLVPSSPVTQTGTDTVFFTGSAASGPYLLTLRGDLAELQSRCGATHFEGQFGVRANGDSRFFGSYVGPERGAALRATLALQTLPGLADSLQLLVQDGEGRSLFGPLQVRRAAAAPTDPPACP